MRQVTATEKYKAVNEGKMAKGEFVRQMRIAYPSVISQFNGYEDTVQILKNKGFVFEVQEEQHNFSDEAVRRGIDIELAAMGCDPANCFDEELINKAKGKALSNLKKHPLHYINLLSGESSKVDKHDKEVEVKKNNHKDTFNDMKKANLKEGVVEETGMGVLREEIVDIIGLLKKERGADNEVIKDFIKTHFNDIKGMSPEEIVGEFDEFVSVNYEAPSDFMQQEVGGVDRLGHKKEDDDEENVSKLSQAKEKIWGMREGFKPGDMWSKDFDYKGMLKAGLMIPEPQGQPSAEEIEHMMKISDSFEDVNYHTENGFLQDAIDAFQHEDEQAGLESLKQFKKAIGQTIKDVVAERVGFERKQVEEDVDEGFNDQLSAEDLADLAQFFYGYAIRTEMDGYTDVADHIDQAARKLAEIEAPDKGPGMEEGEVNEYRGSGDEIKAIIRDRAAESGFSEQEEAEEVMEFIGQEYEIDFEFGAGPSRQAEAKASKDYDKDGKVEDEEEEYKGVKDRAIKSALGKQSQLKEAVKAIIEKVLSEEMINEAATAELSRIGDEYAGFEGMKGAINQLENIVTEIESFYDKTRNKIQKVYDSLGELRNEEGLKVGGFLAPAIEQAFLKDLRPVTKIGFTKGLDQPKVKILSQRDIDMHNSGEKPLGETDIEAPKQTVFSPVMETKKKK